jgi:hypothetical protein
VSFAPAGNPPSMVESSTQYSRERSVPRRAKQIIRGGVKGNKMEGCQNRQICVVNSAMPRHSHPYDVENVDESCYRTVQSLLPSD